MLQARNEPAVGSTRELLGVAIPLVLSSGSLTLMQVVDRIFLAWYSLDATAAALPASLLHWNLLAVFIGAVQYVNTFVAQYEGAGQRTRVAAAVWQGIFLSLLAGIPCTLLAVAAGPIFQLIGHSPRVQELEATYFQILCYGSLPYLGSLALSSFYSGRGATLIVLWVNLACTAINIVLDYLFIFGWGPLPAYGIAGAAWATVIAEWATFLIYAVLLVRSDEWRSYGWTAACRFDRDLFGRLLRYGLPCGLHLFIDVICFTAFILLVGMIGEDVLAATNLAFNLNTLAFLPMLGFGTAVSTLVGNRIGERRPELAIRTTWLAFGWSAGYMAIFACIYLFLPELILAPYASHSEPEAFAKIQATIIGLLRFVAVYSLFDAAAIIFGSAIRGAGDTRFPLVMSFLGGWGIMVLPTWIGYRYYGQGVWFAWAMCTAYVMFLGVVFCLRFQAGHWMQMKVIEDAPGEEPELVDAGAKERS